MVKGEEAGSVGWIWFLSAQARVKVWREAERDSCEPGSGLGEAGSCSSFLFS